MHSSVRGRSVTAPLTSATTYPVRLNSSGGQYDRLARRTPPLRVRHARIVRANRMAFRHFRLSSQPRPINLRHSFTCSQTGAGGGSARSRANPNTSRRTRVMGADVAYRVHKGLYTGVTFIMLCRTRTPRLWCLVRENHCSKVRERIVHLDLRSAPQCSPVARARVDTLRTETCLGGIAVKNLPPSFDHKPPLDGPNFPA